MKRGCTQCGECANVCPVFRRHRREEYSPKGKRRLLEPVSAEYSAAPAPLPWEEVRDLARLCAGCGRCKQACARKLSAADLLAEVRNSHPHWTQYMWELWIKRMGPLWPTLGRLASAVPEGLTPAILQSSLAPAKALLSASKIPVWASLRRDLDLKTDPAPVMLFSGCTANNVRPQWTKKAERLLRAWGYTLVSSTGLTCCGGTMHHAGRFGTMNAMRQQNIAAWRGLGKPRIAVFCASCHHGLAEYADAGQPGAPLQEAEAAEWKSSLSPLSALLVGAKADPTPDKPEIYGYHQPCHWDADKDQPFLAEIFSGQKKGTALCCGMGGILKMTDPALSMSMAEECAGGFPAEARAILTGCSGCVLQLSAAGKSGITARHWLDVVIV